MSHSGMAVSGGCSSGTCGMPSPRRSYSSGGSSQCSSQRVTQCKCVECVAVPQSMSQEHGSLCFPCGDGPSSYDQCCPWAGQVPPQCETCSGTQAVIYVGCQCQTTTLEEAFARAAQCAAANVDIYMQPGTHYLRGDLNSDINFSKVRIFGDRRQFVSIFYGQGIGQWSAGLQDDHRYNVSVGGAGPWRLSSTPHGLCVSGDNGSPDFSALRPGDTLVWYSACGAQSVPTRHRVICGRENFLQFDGMNCVGAEGPCGSRLFEAGEGFYIEPNTSLMITHDNPVVKFGAYFLFQGICISACSSTFVLGTSGGVFDPRFLVFGSAVTLAGQFYSNYPNTLLSTIEVVAGSNATLYYTSLLGPCASLLCRSGTSIYITSASFVGCTRGAQVWGGAKATHLQFVDFVSCDVGLLARSNSNFDVSGCRFVRCAVGIYGRHNSTITQEQAPTSSSVAAVGTLPPETVFFINCTVGVQLSYDTTRFFYTDLYFNAVKTDVLTMQTVGGVWVPNAFVAGQNVPPAPATTGLVLVQT